MLDVLEAGPMTERVAAWYPEFERIEGHDHVDAATVERLAALMADFADALFDTSRFAPTDDERGMMALIEHMQADAFSPAQHRVWSRFLTLIEQRGPGDRALTDT